MDERTLRETMGRAPLGRPLDAPAVLGSAKNRRSRRRVAWATTTAALLVAVVTVSAMLNGSSRTSAVPAATVRATPTSAISPTSIPSPSVTPVPPSATAPSNPAAVRAFPLVVTKVGSTGGDVTGPTVQNLTAAWQAVGAVAFAWADATSWCLRGTDQASGFVPTTPPTADECQPWPAGGASAYLTTGNIDIQPGIQAPIAFLAFAYAGTIDEAAATIDGVKGYPGEVYTVAGKSGVRIVVLPNEVPDLSAPAKDQLPMTTRLYRNGSAVAAYANTSTRTATGIVPTLTPTPATQVSVPAMAWPELKGVPTGTTAQIGGCSLTGTTNGIDVKSSEMTSSFHMVASPNMDPNANRLQPTLCKSSATTWTIVIAILAPGATKVLVTHHATTVAAPLWRFANHPDWVVATYDVAPYASASSSVMPSGYPTFLLAEMALAEDPPAVTAWDATGKTVLRMP